MNLSIVASSGLLFSIFSLAACTPSESARSATAHGNPPDATQLHPRGPKVMDLTGAGVSAPHDSPLPSNPTTYSFVPWDSGATLELRAAGEPGAGALIVRYGQNVTVDGGVAAMIYILEAAGPKIEPISIDWQPGNGSDLRAIARVDGELRHYDFDR